MHTKNLNVKNLHNFIEKYHRSLMVRGDVSMTPAYLKGVLKGIWDMAEGKVQNARRNYFALAAVAFAGDVAVFGGSLHMARLALTAGELAALMMLGTKIYCTRSRSAKQYLDEDLGTTNPDAPEDTVIYDRAARNIQGRIPKRDAQAYFPI